jgi:hypothetical protein
MSDKLWEEPLRLTADDIAIEDANGCEIADCLSVSRPAHEDKAIARELVRRANAYPRLVKVWQDMLEEIGHSVACDVERTRCAGCHKNFDRIRAALAEADHE